MMKMLIKLDEEKIEREGKYDLEKINKIIYKEFSEMGITKDESGLFVNGDFGAFGSMIFALKKADWFLPNVSEWLWYDSGTIEDPEPEDYIVMDLAEHYRSKSKKGT